MTTAVIIKNNSSPGAEHIVEVSRQYSSIEPEGIKYYDTFKIATLNPGEQIMEHVWSNSSLLIEEKPI